MNNFKTAECNGPIQMSDVSVIDNNWKCPDTTITATTTNNGYIKSENGPGGSMGPLLTTTTVPTVVQVTSTGARTMVLPARTKGTRERCLLVTVVALIVISITCLYMLANNNQEECETNMGTY